MKNIFKSLLVVLVGIFCTYIVWAVLYFILFGGWLGVISSVSGKVLFPMNVVIILTGMFAYLDESNDYWN
jgi:hypothetical protein